jgi:hypothetical protein
VWKIENGATEHWLYESRRTCEGETLQGMGEEDRRCKKTKKLIEEGHDVDDSQ